jgi:hypothetical protein
MDRVGGTAGVRSLLLAGGAPLSRMVECRWKGGEGGNQAGV